MKFAIGGQLNKTEIKELLSKEGYKADIFTDTEAAIKVKSGEYDYYLGACQSGAGGALAMAYAILGRDLCATIAMAGVKPTEEKVSCYINEGKKAFGFTNDQVDNSISTLINVLKKMGE